MSWHAAMAYAQWAGKRLPTKAESEYATREGLEDKTYPREDTFVNSDRATNDRRRQNRPLTIHVGSSPPNNINRYDMAGNIWEWHLDDFYAKNDKNYPMAGRINSDLITSLTSLTLKRVLRSGSWSVNPYFLRVAFRNFNLPTLTSKGIGFRRTESVTNN